MLSKEEIENSKSNVKRVLETDPLTATIDFQYNDVDNLLKYIKQLESDNYELNNRINDYIEERRELIEKLEEELERNNRDTKLAETGKLNLSSEEWREIATEDKLINEILSILKGEKE